MKTGAHLKVQKFSDAVHGVELFGDKSKPEPEYFRVRFPGGDVDLTRLDDGSYWVHLRVNRPEDGGDPDRIFASITDARIDAHGFHASETNDRESPLGLHISKWPKVYHVALRVKK